VKKTKKKAEAEPAPAEAAPAPAPAPAAEPPKRASTKKAKRTGSNVFSMFSERQVAEFKDAFQMMDNDKDGVIGKNDLRATYDVMGRIANDKELDEMLNEAPGPINFTMLLTLFANHMGGSVDDEDVVVSAFKSFDEGGKIDSEKFRHALMTWGDKFTANEVEDAFDAMVIDNQGRIDTAKLITLLTAAAEDEEEEA
jgi:Ca2+-binding EF-hand superfamily protein